MALSVRKLDEFSSYAYSIYVGEFIGRRFKMGSQQTFFTTFRCSFDDRTTLVECTHTQVENTILFSINIANPGELLYRKKRYYEINSAWKIEMEILDITE